MIPDPARDVPHGRYRPDIDGLRAVAVLAVVAYHAAPSLLPGGFAGVDVFFVISGYLISGIVIREAEAARFSLLHFYGRRIRRLFPALLVVLAAVTAAAWLLMPAQDLARYARHLLASILFVPNFLFLQESGYFAETIGDNALLHLWSLGVEEQFYLLWPPLLYLMARIRRIGLGIALLAALSFAAHLHYGWAAPTVAFYSPLPRAWELLAGAALAYGASGARGSRRLRSAASVAGALSLLATFLLLDEQALPAWWPLLPVAGSILLIGAGGDALVNRHLLARPLSVLIGLISYPLYLWHWPLLAFASILTLELLPWIARLAAVALSFPLAWLTWRLVERPARAAGPRTPFILLAMMAALGAAALALAAGGIPLGWRPQIDRRSEVLAEYRSLRLAQKAPGNFHGCGLGDFAHGIERGSLPPGCVSTGRETTWMLWGDSHARALGEGLRHHMPAEVGLTQVTTSGCPPRLGLTELCRASDALALDLVRRQRPQVVVLAQQGRHLQRDWESLARELRRAGAERVVLAGPVPQWRRSLPQILVNRYWPDTPEFLSAEAQPEHFAADRRLRAVLGGGIEYVSLVEGLCAAAGCRVTVPGDGYIALDQGHLSPAGSRYVARTILVPQLLSAPPAPAPE